MEQGFRESCSFEAIQPLENLMISLFFLLGAPDAEMAMIEKLLLEVQDENPNASINFCYAESTPGIRLRPGQSVAPDIYPPAKVRGYAVEVPGHAADWVDIDHHDAKNLNTSAPPERGFEASSIGQVIRALAQEGINPPSDWHLLAYNGVPGGISPLGLVGWKLPGGNTVVLRIPDQLVWEGRLDHNLAGALASGDPEIAEYAREGRRLQFAPNMPKAAYDAAIDLALKTLVEAPPALDLDPKGRVADLTGLEPDGPGVEKYPSSFPFGPLVGALGRRGYLVKCRRADGTIALRVGGCGMGSVPGPEPIQRWLDGVGIARGCLPADAPRPNNLYGFVARGMGGGTLG